MNFNLDLKVDKAMNKLAESRTLRVWTYLITILFLLGIMLWQLAPILLATAELINVIQI